MTAVMEDKDIYLESFARFEKTLKDEPAWLQQLRQSAIERFAALGFPTLDDEEWRFTNLAPLIRVPFQLGQGLPRDLSADFLSQFGKGVDWIQLLFVNGQFLRQLPTVDDTRAMFSGQDRLGSLSQAMVSQAARVQPYLGRLVDFENQPFVALNTAFITDGAFISIPKGKVIDKPIHLIFVSTADEEPRVAHPRNLIVLGRDSQATIIASYFGPGAGVYFTNAVTEVLLGENAILDYYEVQSEAKEAFHVHTLQVQQDRSSNFSSHAINLGGALVRNDINAVLAGEGCECTLNGLYLGTDQQLIDNHTQIDHAKPHCASHELYKGILDGKAHGVFNGKIHVHPDAQKTDAKQTNQTLLLSEDATINTKPQLEIYADDVKCTHGATVGQLDAEAIFYLRSRGIGKEEARRLLTFAFANDIIDRIKIEPLRNELEGLLRQRSDSKSNSA
jgi:Fe-S cluster assembly protein SufD